MRRAWKFGQPTTPPVKPPEATPQPRSGEDIGLSLQGLTQPVTVGRSLTYEIRVTNSAKRRIGRSR